jgi:hypothetical protein
MQTTDVLFGLHCSCDQPSNTERFAAIPPTPGHQVLENNRDCAPVTFLHAHKTHSTVLVYSSRGGLSAKEAQVVTRDLLSTPGILGVLTSPDNDTSECSPPAYQGACVL